MTQKYSNNPRVERSLKHSVRDGVSYSVMTGVGETYFSAYALFLAATVAQISLIAAIPPLFGSLAQLLAVWLGDRGARRRTIILVGASLQAFMWLPIVWLPYLYPAQAGPIFIGCVVLYYIWNSLAAPLWASLMGDLVPTRRRGRFFGRRNGLMSMTSFAAMVGAGLVLHLCELHQQTRLGFITIFTIAALARVYSVTQLARMHEPEGLTPECAPRPERRRMRSSRFLGFAVFFGAMNFAAAIASPFFTVYMLRDLGFSYLEYTVVTATAVLMQFLTLGVWGRLGDVFGNRRVLVTTGTIIPILPALWLVSPNVIYIVFVQMLAGMAWAGFGLSATNIMYDFAKPERRAMYAAMQSVFGAVGIFTGALLGGYLGGVIPARIEIAGIPLEWTSGLWGVLLISSLARAVVASIFIPRLREVRPVRSISTVGLLARLARHNPVGRWVYRLATER